jgi:RNA polymerase sigma-70 factor (ECF subfamily)
VEAEDAVQDTFLIAAKRSHEFRGEGSLEGWLVRVVASACSRLARGAKNDPARHVRDAEPASRDESPEVQASRREVGRVLERELLSLSPDDRWVLLLAEVEGYSGEEIARRTGLSHGAIRARLSRLRAKLRESLGQVSGSFLSTP